MHGADNQRIVGIERVRTTNVDKHRPRCRAKLRVNFVR